MYKPLGLYINHPMREAQWPFVPLDKGKPLALAMGWLTLMYRPSVNLPPPAESGASYSTYLLEYMFKALARSSCGEYIIIYNKYT